MVVHLTEILELLTSKKKTFFTHTECITQQHVLDKQFHQNSGEFFSLIGNHHTWNL